MAASARAAELKQASFPLRNIGEADTSGPDNKKKLICLAESMKFLQGKGALRGTNSDLIGVVAGSESIGRQTYPLKSLKLEAGTGPWRRSQRLGAPKHLGVQGTSFKESAATGIAVKREEARKRLQSAQAAGSTDASSVDLPEWLERAVSKTRGSGLAGAGW
eukprot:CAMPEP_0181319246 /NCGR_PEP_ID=MMETSP1101-20121128/17464_1 /TAXON_ID=46948 /ORGANISM="Rhodomonas abbreviata, Strain Caron Lab Isolate" /LENGTH=161 /DNA_ID=CAMNT_0023426823 /DNA_START=177 /DNA_END=659 /DNA_ORIENTATION=+